MTFLLSDDIQDFQKSLRASLERDYPSTMLRQMVGSESGNEARRTEFAIASHSKLAELGVMLAGVPENFGGLGAGVSALAMIIEECARVLHPAPVFETITFGVCPLLCVGASGTAASKISSIFEAIGAGTLRMSGATVDKSPQKSETGTRWTTSSDQLTAEHVLVPSISSVGQILLVLRDGATARLVQVDASVCATQSSVEKTIDLNRSYSRVSLREVPFEDLGTISEQELERLEALQSILAVAEIVGVTSKVEALTLDYVKTRKQFGLPIGSFQAIQHKLADVHLALESARSLLRFAARSADHDHEQFLSSGSAAKGYASDVLPKAIESCLQAHGGIGFTFEYDLHLYLRRAVMMSALFGTSAEHYATLGRNAVESATPLN